MPRDLTFKSLRHGGMTELGDAEATDQEMVAFTTRTRQTLTVYTHGTKRQIISAARKRRAFISERS